MRFAEFISRQLDKKRGLQTKLADKLKISKSTITAWRNGAKPDFEICLLLAEHFDLGPMDIFQMLGDSHYKAVYRRFFNQALPLESEASAPSPQEGRSICEDDLYEDCYHADLHRDLQVLLEANSQESSAITTMIQMATRELELKQQLETEYDADGRPASSRVASIYLGLKQEKVDTLRDRLESEPDGSVIGDGSHHRGS